MKQTHKNTKFHNNTFKYKILYIIKSTSYSLLNFTILWIINLISNIFFLYQFLERHLMLLMIDKVNHVKKKSLTEMLKSHYEVTKFLKEKCWQNVSTNTLCKMSTIICDLGIKISKKYNLHVKTFFSTS